MKIGIDARFWNESGVGRYIKNLVFNLLIIDQKNEYVLFINPKDEKEINTLNKNLKIVPTNINWHTLEEQIKFPQIINKQNIGLMHFPYFSIPVFYDKPFIVTIHDLILHHFTTGKATTKHPLIYHGKRLGYKFVMKQAARKSKKIITVSHTTKNEIIDHLKIDPSKITVIYEGFDSLFFNPKENIYNRISSQFFLHVGNLYPHKNMDLVLNAFKKMNKHCIVHFKIVIVGKEDYFYRRFKNITAKAGLENYFIFLGEVGDSLLLDLYKNALALLSTSFMEGFDLPVVEAMANNCLVLASDIPVHKEICKDSAIYFDPINEDSLLSKLFEISSAKQKYTDKINHAKIITAEFSWQKMARETLKIYEAS